MVTYLCQLIKGLTGRHSHNVRVTVTDIHPLNIIRRVWVMIDFRAQTPDAHTTLTPDPSRLLNMFIGYLLNVSLGWNLIFQADKLLFLLIDFTQKLRCSLSRTIWSFLITATWAELHSLLLL